MKEYNKLVRDKIPEIIRKSNSLPITKVLSDEEYIEMLNKKLIEEVNEYLESSNLEELADIEEVIRGILFSKGISLSQLEDIRKKKEMERGGFYEKIFLERVIDE